MFYIRFFCDGSISYFFVFKYFFKKSKQEHFNSQVQLAAETIGQKKLSWIAEHESLVAAFVGPATVRALLSVPSGSWHTVAAELQTAVRFESGKDFIF